LTAAGYFWEMHAVLFDHQNALEDEDLQRYAVEVGLDGDAFAADLAGGVWPERARSAASARLSCTSEIFPLLPRG